MRKILIALLAIFSLTACQTQSQNQPQSGDDTLKVAATIPPLADIVDNIVGSTGEVIQILPPGASPHTFEFSPSDIKALSDVDVIFIIGNGLDEWVEESVEALSEDVQIVTVDNNIPLTEFEEDHEDEHGHEDEHENEHEDEDEHGHHHEGSDPHYWLNPDYAKIIAENVKNTLSEISPENRDAYQQSFNNFTNDLNIATLQIEAILGELKSRDLIVFHDSWNYFADHFGLNIVGVFEAQPGVEPSPQYLKELYETVEEHDVKAVFSEPQLSSATIEPILKDLELSIYTLDPLGGVSGRETYIELLIYNAQTLAEALR